MLITKRQGFYNIFPFCDIISKQKEWLERDLLIVLIFLQTGMRCSALYKLDVDSIDIDTHTLVTIDKGSVIREYELSEETIEHLKKWLIVRKEKLMGRNESALFISNQRKRLGNQGIALIVNKYGQTIKGKNITPHKLRATYGTQLYEATHDLYFVQGSMGHANPKTSELYIRGQKQNITKKASDIMQKKIIG